MKSVLAMVALIELCVGMLLLLLNSNPSLGLTVLGGAILAGTGYAILDRLDTINETLTKNAVVRPVTAPAKIESPLPLLQPPEFDPAKAVEAMLEVQRLNRPRG